MKNILIRCDASNEIGLGHITRCLELAKQLQKHHFNIIFAIKPYPLAIEKLEEKNFLYECTNLENFEYEIWIKNLLKNYAINLFIGDIRDGFPISLISFMKQNSILTIAIDEPSPYAKECDICFYPPHAKIDKDLYKGKVYQDLEYVILREEFYTPSTKIKNHIPNLLIMMGGTDSFNQTFEILQTIDQTTLEFTITVILNKTHKDFPKIENFIQHSNHKTTLHSYIQDMATFLDNIEFGVVAFGTIIYEFTSKNIPAIALKKDGEDINVESLENLNIMVTQNINQQFLKDLFGKQTINTTHKPEIINTILKEIA